MIQSCHTVDNNSFFTRIVLYFRLVFVVLLLLFVEHNVHDIHSEMVAFIMISRLYVYPSSTMLSDENQIRISNMYNMKQTPTVSNKFNDSKVLFHWHFFLRISI